MTSLSINKIDLKAGLYIVAMPIGNVHDISLRALQYLMSVSYIACEDTRIFQAVFRDLAKTDTLNADRSKTTKLNTDAKLIAYHQHNEQESSDGILKLVKEGHAVALVSDAGTMNISDPGYLVVEKALAEGLFITSLPGSSALTTALSLYPIHGPFSFYGFLPKTTKEKTKLLSSLKDRTESLVFFESPHRLLESLEHLNNECSNRMIFIARELTKAYEELTWTSIAEAIDRYSEKSVKGEFVLILSPPEKDKFDLSSAESQIQNLLAEGNTAKEILSSLKSRFPGKRKEIYDLIEKIKKD